MNLELEEQKNTREEIKIPEAKQEASAVKPEELSEQMTKKSQEEVTDFKTEGKNELENIEKSAAADGLAINESDKAELNELDQKADGAKEELKKEINAEEKEVADAEQGIDSKAVLRKGMEMVHDLYKKGEAQSAKYQTLKAMLIADGKWKTADQVDLAKLQEVTEGKDENYEDGKPSLVKEEKTAFENKSAMKERVIENSELLDKKEASKKFLAEERAKLAEELWEQRKLQKNRLGRLKNIIEAGQEKIEGENGDKQYGKIAELQSHEANLLAERLVSENLSEQDVNEEKENIAQLISNSEGLKSIKAKLQEHYAKADEIAQKKFEFVRKTVEQTILRNNAFIVHTFLLNEELRHNANSNISKRATVEDDIDILLSLEPSISTSSVMPGSRHGLWNEGMGVIIGGGEIRGGAQTDNQTQTGGIKERNGTISTSEEIDEMVSDKDARGYNELVVNNPEVFGFFQNVSVDNNGKMSGFNPRHSNKENFMQHMNLAKEKGMPLMVMTPDRKLFEFLDIDDNGIVSIGLEITPEQVATGKAGLPEEKRIELGGNVISKNLFKKISDQKEAKGIVAELAGEKVAETELTREEYLKYIKDNPGLFNNFPKHLLEDRSFMLEAAQFDSVSAYNFAGENLKKDVEFIKNMYSLKRNDDTRSIYSYIPETLKKEESIALLAIENNDFENIDAKFADSPVVWDKIVDRIVEKSNPNQFNISHQDAGSSQFLDTNFMMGYVNVSDRLVADEKFIQKLNNNYSNYKFQVDDYNRVLVTKLV